MSRFEDYANDMDERWHKLRDECDKELAKAKTDNEREKIEHEFEHKTRGISPWSTNDSIQAAFD